MTTPEPRGAPGREVPSGQWMIHSPNLQVRAMLHSRTVWPVGSTGCHSGVPGETDHWHSLLSAGWRRSTDCEAAAWGLGRGDWRCVRATLGHGRADLAVVPLGAALAGGAVEKAEYCAPVCTTRQYCSADPLVPLSNNAISPSAAAPMGCPRAKPPVGPISAVTLGG